MANGFDPFCLLVNAARFSMLSAADRCGAPGGVSVFTAQEE